MIFQGKDNQLISTYTYNADLTNSKTQLSPSIIEVINLIRSAKQESREFSSEEKRTIRKRIPQDADLTINYFSPVEEEEQEERNPEEPSILLRTFEGSKGLSGGHVFIVGANDGSMPKFESEDEVKDIECWKFIVAMTRTRKQCHIISNRC